MLKKLVIAAIPAIIRRYDSGVDIRVIGAMYGCDPYWLRDRMLKAGHQVRPLEEAPPWAP
ncbi:hypothetical protein [Kitasatospora fiedleri]|uniref:hypothetical protein n=1 Tax=Kitasatospora fiedleri TaxID=2991545 RepID=UPI00249B09C1|nr:hypothetical protein [Kitasatospora fiedleri]